MIALGPAIPEASIPSGAMSSFWGGTVKGLAPSVQYQAERTGPLDRDSPRISLLFTELFKAIQTLGNHSKESTVASGATVEVG